MGKAGENVTMKSWMIFRCVHKIAKNDYRLGRVSLSAWNNSAATGRIEFFFRNSVQNIQFWLKSSKNNVRVLYMKSVRVLYMKTDTHLLSYLAQFFLE
jgi:hypothetical protein